jgi:hypothetical protein
LAPTFRYLSFFLRVSSCPSWIIFFLLCGEASAQLPHIRLDSIFPLGGATGSDVTLEIGGKDLDDAKALHFDHPGLMAEHVKDKQFRVKIAADVPPATYEVRAVGKYGISGVRLFQVSRGLIDVLDKEPNDEPDKAQPVPMNCAINGKSDGNGDDFFRFPAKKGERVVVDCRAFRLDSRLRGMLSIAAADGKPLAQSRPYYHLTDPLLDFVAPADGEYVLRLHDMTFSGGLPYRLIVSIHPQIENVFPMAVVPGAKTELTLLGRNLPGGKSAPEWPLLDHPLDRLTVPFTVPTDPRVLQRFTFIDHLPTPSLNARGMQFWPAGVKNALDPATVTFADAPVTLDREPNDTAESAQTITLPTVVCGRFDRPGDADWYTFKAKKGEAFDVDLLCERLDLPGDPFVILFDAKGKELATFDDHGANVNALAQFNRDPLGVFRVPADGTYRAFVQERYRAGGARYQYVLRLTKATPDIFPVVFHETNPDPTCPLVRRGGSAFAEVYVNRRDYNGPVTVTADGLPPGVTCPPIVVRPQAQVGILVFTASADAPEFSGAIRLKATAEIDGKKLEREVRPAQRRFAIANISPSIMLRETCLAVRPDPAPYAIRLPAQKLTVAAGGTLETTAKLDRAKDFQGKVQLTGLSLPNGFTFNATDVLADKAETPIKITIAANVPPGDYTLVLRGDAQVPFSRDPKATTRPPVRVADPSTPLTVTVTAGKKG